MKIHNIITFGNDDLPYEAIKCKFEEFDFDGRHRWFEMILLCIIDPLSETILRYDRVFIDDSFYGAVIDKNTIIVSIHSR